jgi:hypothetical protein
MTIAEDEWSVRTTWQGPTVDFFAAPSYKGGINASSPVNIDYMDTNISGAVKSSSESCPKMVPLDDVIRGGGLIVGGAACMSLLATAFSGAIIIQPLFAIGLLITCAGFYVMTLVKNG